MIIKFSDKAKEDLFEILDYYRNIGRLKTGRKIRADILTKTMKLKDFPYVGPIEERLDNSEKEKRYIVVGQYKIIYHVSEKMVFILTVFDTRQDPGKMLG